MLILTYPGTPHVWNSEKVGFSGLDRKGKNSGFTICGTKIPWKTKISDFSESEANPFYKKYQDQENIKPINWEDCSLVLDNYEKKKFLMKGWQEFRKTTIRDCF